MQFLLYSEINILCILFLSLILFKVLTGIDMHLDKRLFIFALIGTLVMFASDLVWILIDKEFLRVSVDINYLVNIIYYIFMGVTGYAWFLYSENIQGSAIIKNKSLRILSIIPFIFISIMIVASYKTGWIFYIDENNEYHRGSLHILQAGTSYAYIIFTSVKAFIKSLDKNDYVNRSKYMTLLSFAIPPLVFGMGQTLLPGLPLMCVGITTSFLWVYLEFQEQRISLDPLTQLNNRSQLIKFLSNKIKYYENISSSSKNKNHLYLLMMDADHFKKINDIYGHVEGDRALIRIAESLKQSCHNCNSFVARFGGDEFIIIKEASGEGEIKEFSKRINEILAANNEKSGVDYLLSLSIGHAKYTKDMKSIQEFIAMGDKELYIVKKARDSHRI